MKVPILLLARELHLGGSERQLTEIAVGLDRERFEPHVGTFHPRGIRGDELRAAGVPILHLPVHSFRSPAALAGAWQLAQYVRRHQIRLVHTFDAPLTAFAIPVVHYFTSALAISSQRAHRDLAGKLRNQLRRTDRMVEAIVVNCEYVKKHLIEDEHLSPQLIHVCYNGIDLEKFRTASTPRPSALPEGALVIGVVCAMRPEKGLATLIDAFARVRSVQPHMKLVLVGTGPEVPSLQARARDAGIISDCVWQPATANVADWLRAFDIFVLPSLTEALSNSLMEAMACGCAVIASDVGGNPELVGSGERGILFQAADVAGLADALCRMIKNPSLRSTLAAKGEEFIRTGFSRQASAHRMAEIYASLLVNRR